MIGVALACELRDAGLKWEPAHGDFFTVPGTALADQVFIVSDMAAIIESVQGTPAVTFHGTPEWALDYLYLGDAVWLPSEGQLRGRLQRALEEAGTGVYDLAYVEGSYLCRFEWQGQPMAFAAALAEEAYARALMEVLRLQR